MEEGYEKEGRIELLGRADVDEGRREGGKD